jgi:DNA invertase Pin-like site-specific DNA recombinase
MSRDGQEHEVERVRAAQYLRMSTEHQNYSLGHQAAALETYAAANGYEIVRSYMDSGISGISLKGRDGLKGLLADVVGGSADYSVVLIFDVSRWGRFQDVDESAHYEFLCKQAGVRIEYCAELFANDGSLASTLVKYLKRAMAGEFSRDLSAKVMLAQRRLAAKGFWQGGPPGYALRRQLVLEDGRRGETLAYGQRKAIMGWRVVLAKGPPDEVAIVQRIFRMFVVHGLSAAAITRTLNGEAIVAEGGAPWSPSRVRQVLTSEKYVGVQIFGKTISVLGEPPRRQHPETWERTAGVIEPMVSREMFDLAQRNVAKKMRLMSKAEMTQGLAGLLRAYSHLSAGLINQAEHLPCAQTYAKCFGSLLEAYAAVGFRPSNRAIVSGAMVRKGMICTRRNRKEAISKEEMIDRLRAVYERHGRLTVQIINDSPELPCEDTFRRVFGDVMTAYELAGYRPTKKQRMASAQRMGMTGGIALYCAKASREAAWRVDRRH